MRIPVWGNRVKTRQGRIAGDALTSSERLVCAAAEKFHARRPADIVPVTP